MEYIIKFLQQTGFYLFADGNWMKLVMIGISCILLNLGIVKKFEPLLLVPIAFGMLLTNCLRAVTSIGICLRERRKD